MEKWTVFNIKVKMNGLESDLNLGAVVFDFESGWLLLLKNNLAIHIPESWPSTLNTVYFEDRPHLKLSNFSHIEYGIFNEDLV